jgi:hypothetical protein
MDGWMDGWMDGLINRAVLHAGLPETDSDIYIALGIVHPWSKGLYTLSDLGIISFPIPAFATCLSSFSFHHSISNKNSMSPAVRVEPPASWVETVSELEPYDGPPRNVKYIEDLKFDESLRPKKYEIEGTDPESKILILDVSILDSTGREPYKGDVLIEGV